MRLEDFIKKNWEKDIVNQIQSIAFLNPSFPAWTIRTEKGRGVAVCYDGPEIREDFASVSIFCAKVKIEDKIKTVLVLLSSGEKDVQSFAALCADFVNPGENGEFRNDLLSFPLKWWASWKELLGNKSIDERVYDVIGELAVLRYYAQKGLNPKWNGPNQSSYDIELDDSFVEVKSSINRTKKEITISSIYQLSNLNKKLYLTFCTFELTAGQGESINSLVRDLRLLGYNVATINEALEKKGFGVGKSDRNKTFILHSMYQYIVEEKFPKVTEQSFINGTLPSGIIDISYTVDLSGLDAVNLMVET